MFQILIVDDEPVILNGCRLMLEKKMDLPFPLEVYTANGAESALAILERLSPELILTDIRMPVIDGFAFINELQKRGYEGKIMILTSHADFEYARTALRLGVSDFLLKPINMTQFNDVLISVYEEKCKKAMQQKENCRRDLLTMMLYDISPSDFLFSGHLLQELFPYPHFTVLLLSVPNGELHTDSAERILLNYYDTCQCFFLNRQKLFISLCCSQSATSTASLKKELSNLLGYSCTFGLSHCSDSLSNLHLLYQEALQNLFSSNASASCQQLKEAGFFSYAQCIDLFLDANNRQHENLKEFLHQIINFITAGNPSAKKIDLQLLTAYIYGCFSENLSIYLRHLGIASEISFTPSEPVTSLPDLLHMLIRDLDTIKTGYLQPEKKSVQDVKVKEMLLFIKKHYAEHISLDDLSDAVGLNPNYACSLFKRSVGVSYLSWLHQERLQAAKKLLIETDYTIEVIAEQVGYYSSSQFGKIFRKHEKISPTDYRNRRLS